MEQKNNRKEKEVIYVVPSPASATLAITIHSPPSPAPHHGGVVTFIFFR
jgi:hypothetical protein